jgi:hypothetical protein
MLQVQKKELFRLDIWINIVKGTSLTELSTKLRINDITTIQTFAFLA